MQKDPARLPPLDLLTAFEAAARHLSFTKAATERFLTQSAISRQIKALEDDLGVALFRRKHRALALTDEGTRLHEAVRAALQELRAEVTRIRAPQRREVIALTTTPGLASLWLIPRLNEFLRLHPGIDVRIDTSLKRRDLNTDGFDLAIRYSRVGSSAGPQLFREATLPVCHPALARSREHPLKTPADLRHHTLLQITVPPGTGIPLEWQPWLQAVGLGNLEPAAILSFSNYDSAIAAALAQQGVALGRRPLIDGLLRNRRLVAPFKGDAIASERAYFLVTAPGARSRPAVRALEEWLLAQAALPDA
ncbi:MAG: LysR substrate-binding domain-containing protein [Gemmatimonadota bacterium]